MLDDAAERVAVRSDDQVLTSLELRHDALIPVRQGATDGELERLAGRKLVRRDVGVARVLLNDLKVPESGVTTDTDREAPRARARGLDYCTRKRGTPKKTPQRQKNPQKGTIQAAIPPRALQRILSRLSRH